MRSNGVIDVRLHYIFLLRPVDQESLPMSEVSASLKALTFGMNQAQGFMTVHATVYHPFIPGRYLVSANQYRILRVGAFTEWSRAVA